MNRLEQAVFDGLVGAADHNLERRDHVADHVFGPIMEQQRKPKSVIASAIASAAATPCDLLRQPGMLRHREDVVPGRVCGPARPTVPAVSTSLYAHACPRPTG